MGEHRDERPAHRGARRDAAGRDCLDVLVELGVRDRHVEHGLEAGGSALGIRQHAVRLGDHRLVGAVDAEIEMRPRQPEDRLEAPVAIDASATRHLAGQLARRRGIAECVAAGHEPVRGLVHDLGVDLGERADDGLEVAEAGRIASDEERLTECDASCGLTGLAPAGLAPGLLRMLDCARVAERSERRPDRRLDRLRERCRRAIAQGEDGVERRAHAIGLLAQGAPARIPAFALHRPARALVGLAVAAIVLGREPHEHARETAGALHHLVDARAFQARPVQARQPRGSRGLERAERDRREARAIEQRSERGWHRRAVGDAERDATGEPRDHVERVRIGRVQRIEHERAVADLASDGRGHGIGVVLDDLVSQRVGQRQQRHPRQRAEADACVGGASAGVRSGAQERALADARGTHHGDRPALCEQRRGTKQIGVPPDEVSFQRGLAAWVKDRRHFRRFRRPHYAPRDDSATPYVARTTD